DEVNFSPWMTLLEELASLGRADVSLDVESYTVELGSLERINPQEMIEDARRILNYLQHKKMVSGEPSLPQEQIYCCTMEDYISYVSPASGLAVIDHPPGTKFNA